MLQPNAKTDRYRGRVLNLAADQGYFAAGLDMDKAVVHQNAESGPLKAQHHDDHRDCQYLDPIFAAR